MTAMVVAREALVEARKARLLGPIDLAVEHGEHVLVTGPSGSGKTTLLRAIAGLARLARGRIELDGVIASDGSRLALPPSRRRVGFVFQGAALWPHMSVERTLAFSLRHSGAAHGRAEIARRVGELVECVELRGLEARMPATLSGGEAQRLALARALSISPRLLLLDEPLGPLDAKLRGSMLARLAELTRRLGLTTIHVTHDPEEAAALATRTLRIERGMLASAREESVR